MAHKRWPVFQKKRKRLAIGKMPFFTLNPLFQIRWITSILQHALIIIGFKKSSMALFKIMNHLFAGITNVCKHANLYSIAFHNKAVRIYGIMEFFKRGYIKTMNCNG